MKTTVEIPDALMARAKRHARKLGKPFRALIEEGLRRVLEAEPPRERYRMEDRSVGTRGARNPLEHLSWTELRDIIYGGRG
jgi:hypothetical protein